MGFANLLGFLEILKEACKIFFRNGKLMPSIALLSIVLNSILLFSYLFSTQLLVTDYSTKVTNLLLDTASTTDPLSPTASNSYYLRLMTLLKHELRLLILDCLIFTVASFFASFFFAVAIILVSAENFVGKLLYVKELASMVRKSWQRALVTFCYTTLLGLGYLVFVLTLIILPLELIFLNNPLHGKLSAISIVALILALILYNFLAVIWTLALVVSVLEEKCGFKALWRASEVVKGLKLGGFLLNFLFAGLSVAMSRVWRVSVINDKLPLEAKIRINIVPLVLLIAVVSLIKVFYFISYTVLYFEGKKIHGEEVIEMQGYVVEYTKVPGSASPISSDIP